MLSFPGSLKVFIALAPCDMRAGVGTLQGMVSAQLQDDPRSGSLFVFSNRRHSVLKILYWDGSGWWLLTKRLEQGTFSWPAAVDPAQTKLTLAPQALAMLTDGIDLRGAKMRPWYEREAG